MNYLKKGLEYILVFAFGFILIYAALHQENYKPWYMERKPQPEPIPCEVINLIEEPEEVIQEEPVVQHKKTQRELIEDICSEYGISSALVMSLIEHESKFDALAISDTGDYGLCQINKVNHSWLKEDYGLDNLFEPEQNVRACCIILTKLYDKYESDEAVLMAYHMGEGGAKKLWNKGVYSTRYTREILARKGELEK